MANAGLLSSQKSITAARLKDSISTTLSANMSNADAEAKTREIMVSMGLSAAFGRESHYVVKLNAEKLRALVQSGKLSEAAAMEIAMHNGITFSLQKQTASIMPKWIAQMKASVAMLKEQAIATAKWLAMNPAAWCAAAAVGVLALNKVINDNIKSLDEQKKQLENANTNISNNDNEISNLQGNINSNKEQIEQLTGSTASYDTAKIKALENENFGYLQQIELLKTLNEQEKLNAQQTTQDIINNTALITTMQKQLDNLTNLDIKGFISELPMVSGIKDAFAAINAGFSAEGFKKALSANFKMNPVTSLLSTLIPKKENDKSITEITSSQIKNISNLRNQLSDLEKQRDSMSSGKYLKEEQKIKDKISSESFSLITNIKQLQEYQQNLDKSSNEFKEVQGVLDEYTKSLAQLPEYNSFDNILNSEAFGSSKDELIALAKQGSLTGDILEQNYHNMYLLFQALGLSADDVITKLKVMPDTLFSYEKNSESIDNFQSKVSRLSQALSDIRSGSMDQSGLLDLKQEFTSLDITSDNLDEQIEKLINTLLQNLYTTLGNPPDSLKEMLKGIADEAVSSSKSVKSFSDSISSIKSNFSLLEDAKEMLDSGFDMDILQSMISTYGEPMETIIAKYSTEFADSQDVFEQLENCYKQDEENYINSIHSKLSTDDEYFSLIINSGDSLIKEYADAYGIDYSNWKNLQQAKIESEESLVTRLKGMWGDYLDVVFDENGFASVSMKPMSYDDDMNWANYETSLQNELTQYNRIISEISKPPKFITSAVKNKSLLTKTSSDSSDSSDTTDTLKEEFDEKLALLDHYHDMGRVKDEQYYQSLNELNEEYFAGQEEYLDDYRSYSEKIYEGLKQSYKDMLNGQLGYMDQTVSAVTGCLDKGIDALEQQKEAVENEYNTRIEALEGEQKALEEQQESLEKQKDFIQEQIDAIEKANEARQKAIDLQKKQYALSRAMNQNTKQVYVNGQMTWQTDDAAVRDARSELDSALTDAETDKLQTRIDALDKTSKSIDDEKDMLQAQIDSLNDELESITAGIDKQIDALQKYRDRWSEIPDHFEEAQNSMIASMMLGSDWQAGVLAMDEAMLENFSSVYTNIQGQVQAVTDASASQIAGMAGLTCASMDIMADYTDEELSAMSTSMSDNSIIGSGALADLSLSGSASIGSLADSINSSAQSTTDSLKNIITAAEETRTALEKLSSFQDSMHALGLHGFIQTSDTDTENGTGGHAVPIDITLMKNGGVVQNGIISGIPHSPLAKELGEDCLVAVKEGEGFVTPEQTDKLQRLLDSVNNPLADASPVPPMLSETLRRIDNSIYNSMRFQTPDRMKDSIGNNVVFQSGAFNINLNEMRDVTALGEAIVRELPNIVTRKLNPRP